MNAVSTIDRATSPRGMMHRFVATGLEQSADGTLKATLSSESPCDMEFGQEILVHTPEAVDLSRAVMGLPLLIDHDPNQQLGRVENIRLSGRKLVGDIRLSERADLAGIVADVRSGIRPDVSVGYYIEETNWDAVAGAYLTSRWTLYEVSSVALPADHTVGIGRSLHSMRNLNMNAPTSGALAPSYASPAAPTALADHGERNLSPAVRAERDRVANIRTLATRLNCAELGERAIREGHDLDTFTAIYSERAETRSFSPHEAMPSSDSLFDREVGRFSVSRAIAGAINGRLDGREAEIHAELVKRSGRSAQGFFVPLPALAMRTQLVGTAAVGGNLVGTDHMPDAFINPFRATAKVIEMGATVLNDLVGNAELPRQDTATAGTWVAEDVAASETTLNFSQVVLSPKTVTANLSWSRQQAIQGLPVMEELLRRDLSIQLGNALDQAAINGSGSSNQPRGILNTSGIGSVAGGTNGAAPTWDNIVDLESAISAVDAGESNRGYLTNGKVRGKLKRTQKFATTNGDAVWGSDGKLNGYRAEVSSLVPSTLTKGSSSGVCSAIVFGDWSELIVGMWSAVDILVDPYFYSDRGRVRISAFLSADIGVKHASGFAAMVDALTV